MAPPESIANTEETALVHPCKINVLAPVVKSVWMFFSLCETAPVHPALTALVHLGNCSCITLL